jgi:hypothetical protein
MARCSSGADGPASEEAWPGGAEKRREDFCCGASCVREWEEEERCARDVCMQICVDGLIYSLGSGVGGHFKITSGAPYLGAPQVSSFLSNSFLSTISNCRKL